MPELPEVQTIVNDLKPLLSERSIVKASYVGKAGQDLLRKSRIDLSLSLPGKRITLVKRLAKQIVLDLDSGEYLIFHLKITGRLLFRDQGYRLDEFTRLVIELDGSKQLRFTDRNGFADAYLASNMELDQIISRYGPEVLEESLSCEKFYELVVSSSEPTIKETLLNQKIISGVGNIYADEALIVAKIHPTFPAKQMSFEQAVALLKAVRQVLNEGLDDRGTTIDSYVDPFGNPGKHREMLRVYGRSGQGCPICGSEIEYTEVGGRRTYFCPNCQSLPQLSLF
jgi:formamidopyrimidine-DNA glycosylase